MIELVEESYIGSQPRLQLKTLLRAELQIA
jgi:hypothetical protein